MIALCQQVPDQAVARPLPLALAVFGFWCLAVRAAPAPAAEPAVVVVKAAALHVGDGRVIDRGAVLLRGGSIAEVGAELAVPDGATVIEVERGSITPGLIDANARLEPLDILPSSRRTAAEVLLDFFGAGEKAREGDPSRPGPEPEAEAAPGDDAVGRGHPEEAAPETDSFAPGVRSVALAEQSSEVVPHTRVIDTIDFTSPDFQRLARGGVTTVYASPDSSAVIGSRGAILKTAGPVEVRVLRPAAAVKAVMGSDSIRVGSSNRPLRYYSANMYTRRPTTRMGVTWVFRKALYDTIARSQGLPVSGADTPSAPASAVLSQVLAKEIPLRVQARTVADITTACRLAAEFKIPFTLEEGTEAHRALELLKANSVPVIYGPIEMRPRGLRRYSRDGEDARLYTLRTLLDGGVTTALSAQDLREEDGLARQAMYAMRFGLAPEQALRAVTSTPARLLGIEKEVGTVEPGKHADLVVWSGAPFAATSRVVVVMVGGEIVVDRRSG